MRGTIQTRISVELYNEIKKAQECLEQNEEEKSTQAILNGEKKYKGETINFQVASQKIGKYLKSLRDNQASRGIFKWR